jgi:hypothetical protein
MPPMGPQVRLLLPPFEKSSSKDLKAGEPEAAAGQTPSAAAAAIAAATGRVGAGAGARGEGGVRFEDDEDDAGEAGPMGSDVDAGAAGEVAGRGEGGGGGVGSRAAAAMAAKEVAEAVEEERLERARVEERCKVAAAVDTEGSYPEAADPQRESADGNPDGASAAAAARAVATGVWASGGWDVEPADVQRALSNEPALLSLLLKWGAFLHVQEGQCKGCSFPYPSPQQPVVMAVETLDPSGDSAAEAVGKPNQSIRWRGGGEGPAAGGAGGGGALSVAMTGRSGGAAAGGRGEGGGGGGEMLLDPKPNPQRQGGGFSSRMLAAEDGYALRAPWAVETMQWALQNKQQTPPSMHPTANDR